MYKFTASGNIATLKTVIANEHIALKYCFLVILKLVAQRNIYRSSLEEPHAHIVLHSNKLTVLLL